VPPLPPEYLPETIKVIVESLPKVDAPERWPIWLSAGATLLGSFGGAIVSGWVGYKGTRIAYVKAERKDKLEKIYLMLLSNHRKYLSLSQGIEQIIKNADYKPSLPKELYSLAQDASSEVVDAFGILNLMKSEYDSQINEFFEVGGEFNKGLDLMISQAGSNGKVAKIYVTSAKSALDKALEIHGRISSNLADDIKAL
tara:strand:+ start:11799 stop:12392 length:594 start_codon:yes stop_codon:yes gene_type:complete